MALYMLKSLSAMMSIHLVSTTLGILSGLRALYGLSLHSCLRTCSLMMLSASMLASC